MGADQSSSIRSQRDDDFPVTAYDINKPIDEGSPSLSARPKTTTLKKSTSQHPTDVKHDIIVISEGTVKPRHDAELQKLNAVPTFLPILKNSLPATKTPEPEQFEKLNNSELLALCSRYQDHLRQCAEAVAFDQNALCVRIKEIDVSISSLYLTLSERQKLYTKYSEQIQKVQELHSTLNKINFTVQQILPLMDKLNGVLPAEQRLEKFDLDVKT